MKSMIVSLRHKIILTNIIIVSLILSISVLASPNKANASGAELVSESASWGGETSGKIFKYEVLANAKKLGIPVASSSGKFNEEQARTLCLTRLLTGAKPHRGKLTKVERSSLSSVTQLTPPKWARSGLNVSVTCQGAFWLEEGEITRIMPVSTGRVGYRTRVGSYIVSRQWDGWHNSTQYGTPLYKTSYFSGGQAVHGLESDSSVKPYPASAGCVRMHKKDAAWVYSKIKGKRITIRGSW